MLTLQLGQVRENIYSQVSDLQLPKKTLQGVYEEDKLLFLQVSEEFDENCTLHIQLPEEFYELYQWKNGTHYERETVTLLDSLLFFGTYFSELGSQHYISAKESVYDYGVIFMFNRDEYSFVLDMIRWKLDSLQSPPLAMLWTNTEDPYREEVVFASLTSMMLTLAEALEAKVCWFDAYGDLTGDPAQLKTIHQKYNSGCEIGFSKWLDWWLGS